jgi:hypothetical protein
VSSKLQLAWLAMVGLGLFAGLCALFALVVTVAEAWQEHARAQWPETTARVEQCRMRQVSTGRRQAYFIDCRLVYEVGFEQFATRVYSRHVPSPDVWQYPPNQIAPYQDWVDQHPPGTPISVRYDPGNPKKAILAAAYMPFGGPRTPNNVKLLGFFAAICFALLVIGRITRPQSGPLAPRTA